MVSLLSPEAKLKMVVPVGEKSPDSALPAVTEMGMDSERSAAGDTLTVKVAELPSLTLWDGEKDTFSSLGMRPSPVGDQPLGPSLFFACT